MFANHWLCHPLARTATRYDVPTPHLFHPQQLPKAPLPKLPGGSHSNNPELNELIDHAMIHNPSLEQVWARLKQADATAKRLGAARLPSINLTGGFTSTEAVNTGADIDQWSVGVAATSYELDLWGRVNAVQTAARLDAESARFAAETAAMSPSAEVAIRWHNVLARRMELAILREQLKANRTSLELIELRFRKSFSTGLAVLQQRQTVESTAALIPLANALNAPPNLNSPPFLDKRNLLQLKAPHYALFHHFPNWESLPHYSNSVPTFSALARSSMRPVGE